MKIQVLGSGCPSCKKLHKLTQQAATKLNIKDEVEYITDLTELIKLGVMGSPVLAINGKPALVGSIPDIEKIKSILKQANDPDSNLKQCSCGGNC